MNLPKLNLDGMILPVPILMGRRFIANCPSLFSFFTKFCLPVHLIAILIDGAGPGILQKNLRKLASVLIPVQMMVV